MKKQSPPFVSVIMPTFNRSEILEKSLGAFAKQNYSLFEVVVIDDGSTDDTSKRTKNIKKTFPKLNLGYLCQKHKGPSAARNLGIKKAKGEIILIVNDDSIPKENLISEHIKFHLKYPKDNYAVLGFFTWSPEIEITPFMKWLEESGPQFSYFKIKGNWAEWYHFWTCNLSLKRNFLLKHGLFDESFPYAAWEDVELGYRLSKHDLKMLYNKEAIAYHYHPTSLLSTINRMEKHGFSAGFLGDKINESSCLPPLAVPSLAFKLNFIDRLFFTKPVETLFFKLASWGERKYNLGPIYDYLLLHFRIIGRRDYLNKC